MPILVRSYFPSDAHALFVNPRPLDAILIALAEFDHVASSVPEYFRTMDGFDVLKLSAPAHQVLLAAVSDIRDAHQLYLDCLERYGPCSLIQRILEQRDKLDFLQGRVLPLSMCTGD